MSCNKTVIEHEDHEELEEKSERRGAGAGDMKKRITFSILLVLFIAVVWFVFTIKRTIELGLDASNRGHMYRNFFGALEMYSEQTGEFPTSLEDMLTIETQFGYEGVRWPQDAQSIIAFIQPNFDIIPATDNLEIFAPDYKAKADWGDVHCEFYWSQIIEHLNANQ